MACTLTTQDGTHYDLSSLSSSKADYSTQVGNSTYKLNVCQSVVSELWNLEDPESVGGFVGRLEGDFSLGTVNSTLVPSPSTNEPLMIMTDGSTCSDDYTSASTVIRFVCSPADYGAGTPTLIATIPADPDTACQFFFEWKTHVACPTSPKAQLEASHYITFGVFLAIAFFTWFGAHTVYNRFYLKLRGSAQFPIPSLPSFKIPSFKRSSDNSRPGWGSWRGRQRSSYNAIRAEEVDEDEGFAARFSLDDDDEGLEDARALGNEANAWRGNNVGTQEGRVGVHQGLVDV